MVLKTLLFLPALTIAGGPIFEVPEPDPQPIFGGDTVEVCGWQSVVLLRGFNWLCSGNLIHPEIVATAAHCIEVMDPDTRVYFGDTANSADQKANVEYCMMNPDFVSSGDGTIAFDMVQNDYAFCKLETPVTDVVPIPPIFGCELEQVVQDADIIRVGFGRGSATTSQFFKRWVELPIQSIPFTDENGWPAQLSEGGGGQGTCPGDSGGPSFIQVPGNANQPPTWRQVSIQSSSQYTDEMGEDVECGTYPNNSAGIAQAVLWIEEQSGVDVAPCYNSEGDWEPTFECQAFPEDPADGEGTWTGARECEPGALSGFGDQCGTSFEETNPDSDAPNIQIVDPPGDVVEEWMGVSIPIHVVAEADDGDGWGMNRVDLVIYDGAGAEVGIFPDFDEGWEWDPEFPQGEYEIVAIAHDNAGLTMESNRLSIFIGVDPPAADESGEGGGNSGTGGETGASGEDGEGGGEDEGGGTGSGSGGGTSGEGDSGDDGCGCTTSSRPPLAMFGLLCLLAIRRRRD